MAADREVLAYVFDEIASKLAKENPITLSSVESQLRTVSLSDWTDKRILKALLRTTKDYHRRAQLGRLRAAVLIGTRILGISFITRAERAQIFLWDEISSDKFDKFLAILRLESSNTTNHDWRFLCRRLKTYITYRQLSAKIAESEAEILPLLQSQPRDAIAAIFSLTNLRFLQTYFDFPVMNGDTRWLDELGPAEDVASIASTLVALANGFRPLDGFDFAPPMRADLGTPEVRRLMTYGHAKFKCLEVAKDISNFGYRLELSRSSPTHTVFYLRPPSAQFEHARRLGFIRSEMGVSTAHLKTRTKGGSSRLSLRAAAEAFVTQRRDKFQDIKDDDTPFRRVRIMYRTGPAMCEAVWRTGFYDDESDMERLSQDFLVPIFKIGDKEIQLTETLNVESFLRIWRYFQFLCLIDIYVVRPFALSDPIAFHNSLLRVARETDIIEMLTTAGFSQEQVRDFLRLVSADTQQLGYYDLQYRPFLRLGRTHFGQTDSPREIVHLPAAVAVGNALRNVQAANQIRISANADLFVNAVAQVLGTRFTRVQTNRKVRGDAGETDIDVLVMEGKSLYMFECKHSVPPTSPHEMRDIWEDIEKGVDQLQRAISALNEPGRLKAYLNGWFPTLEQEEMREIHLIPCVLCSHRIFSGMNHKEIPVRDFSSLAKLVEDGIIAAATPAGDETVVYRYRVVSENGFSAEDLAEYVSPESRYFKMFGSCMLPISDYDRFAAFTLARETYVYTTEMGDWFENMNGLGFFRLPDERKKWTTPWTAEDLLSDKSKHEA